MSSQSLAVAPIRTAMASYFQCSISPLSPQEHQIIPRTSYMLQVDIMAIRYYELHNRLSFIQYSGFDIYFFCSVRIIPISMRSSMSEAHQAAHEGHNL